MALKSRLLSSNWERVASLCESSIRSALQQTEPSVKVLLICHEQPPFGKRFDDRLEIISVDFPPPSPTYAATMEDKWRKLHIGMMRAGELQPDFVMIMDADDLVSNRLAEHTLKHPNCNGWIIRRGYHYRYGSHWIGWSNDFNCGTNAIVSSRLIRFPKDLREDSRKNCIVLRWGHTKIAEKLAEAGTPLEALPFRGAVYVAQHGDNHSHDVPLSNRLVNLIRSYRNFVRSPRMIVPLTGRIQSEFSL